MSKKVLAMMAVGVFVLVGYFFSGPHKAAELDPSLKTYVPEEVVETKPMPSPASQPVAEVPSKQESAQAPTKPKSPSEEIDKNLKKVIDQIDRGMASRTAELKKLNKNRN